MDNTVQVFFPDGTMGDLARLQREYGSGINVLRSPRSHAFRLRKINVRDDGNVSLIVWVIGKTGWAKVGQPVTYSFASLSEPYAGLPPITGVLDAWSSRGVQNKNRTDGAGRVEFEIGSESWIKNGRGPYALFVLSGEMGSDCIDGVGWKMGTNHTGPVEVFFYEEDEIGGDDDPGDDTDDTGDTGGGATDTPALVRIAVALERLVTHLGA